MKFTKIILAGLLSVVMIASLVACGGNDGDSSTPSETSSVADDANSSDDADSSEDDAEDADASEDDAEDAE